MLRTMDSNVRRRCRKTIYIIKLRGAQAVLARPLWSRPSFLTRMPASYAVRPGSPIAASTATFRPPLDPAFSPGRGSPQETRMPSFPGVDFLAIDPLLNDEEKLARQSARQFVDDAVLPVIEKHNR